MNEHIKESKRILVWSVTVLLCAFAGYWWGMRTGRGIQLLTNVNPGIPLCILMLAALLIQGLSNLKADRRYSSFYRLLVWYSGIMIPVLIYGLGCMVALDIVTFLVHHLADTGSMQDYDLSALIAIPVSCVITLAGLIHARLFQVKKYQVSLHGLRCQAADRTSTSRPCRVVQLSDLHAGSVSTVPYIRRVLRKTAALHPDYVVLTGDTFNHGFVEECPHPDQLAQAFQELNRQLATDAHPAQQQMAEQLPAGSRAAVSRIFAVLGNHDPLPNDPALQEFLRASGITLLHDQAVELPEFILAGRGGNHIHPRPALSEWLPAVLGRMQGCPQIQNSQPPIDGINAPNAADSQHTAVHCPAAPCPPNPQSVPAKPVILLDHYPDGIYEAQQLHVDLMLSGHTHGGQYFPCNLLIRRHYAHGKLLRGRSVWGSTQSIVSQGAGFFQIPIRIGTSSEIVCIDLVSEP